MRKFLDRLIAGLLSMWVVLQFVSFPTEIKKVPAANLAAEIQDTWKRLKEKNLLHGSLLITQGDRVVFSDGPLDLQYSIASVSKSFVGARFTELEKSGLDLNAPVCQWLKNFCKGRLAHITIEHLLNHQAGFGRDLSFLQFAKRTVNTSWTIQDIDIQKLDDSYLHSDPGSKMQYSNFGYLVLSRLLEIIEQKSFSVIIQDLARRAHLHKTSTVQRGDVLPIYILMPFSRWGFAWNIENSVYHAAGAGGLKSSVQDLIQWIDFSYRNSDQDYARGWVRTKKQSYKAYWHNGATFGSYTLIAVLPDENIRVALSIDNFKFTKQWSEMAEQFEQHFY
ncbi:hypothetical protein AZI86_08720 [Bdellovibrio bacteriovorus]|uniref:Beta-lactamase-related domain-containing protein n=1 Tax=Bdellovibrio bacteriovorus TaxID=959 RepID=A0A150WRY1_BDEBC|nr:serine hydrolase domain-containing protein [Bdellovibrio bacteriovorus]KYG67084.1 hypothetical protein AZI86_08720 [Bdellovibrio bacteriovorus]